MTDKIKFKSQADELIKLLAEDQAEKKAVGQAYFDDDLSKFQQLNSQLKTHIRERTEKLNDILNNIGAPSITNIGIDAAQAISVLAVHTDVATLRRVLELFNDLYVNDRQNVPYQSIPSMTDRLLILEHKPQRYGTQWMFDENKQPFLPTVEDFNHINERRAEYSIGPLRWPKSLAIPESEQPWLDRPLSELIMRDPTESEYADFE